ncbi:unnamed protein product [Amoebophrya sp. A25]|nr:unnamed protein product [Amoebophrya sp. A25]|eukprot:GSA25T00015939001.1
MARLKGRWSVARTLPLFLGSVLADERPQFICEGKQTETEICREEDCAGKECRDCTWGEWLEWGPPSCLGLCERHREVAEHNNYCGKPCSGPSTETKSCPSDCEPPPVDCDASEWGQWSQCSELCGGGQTFRERKVVQFPERNGKPCNFELKQVKACNTQVCNEPQHCKLSQWGTWGECSQSCNGGTQERARTVIATAMFGGIPCQGDLKEIRLCNDVVCKDPIDCVWADWGDWSACSASCGGGERTRLRLIEQSPRSGGQCCEPNDMVELEVCNTQPCGEIVDCTFSEWGYWSDCSSSCNGIKTRTRQIDAYPFEGKACEGGLKEVKPCNDGLEHCGLPETPDPVDGTMSEWSAFDACSATCGGGYQTERRELLSSAKYGGKAVQGELVRVKPCNTQPCAPEQHEAVDCKYGEWGYWSYCSASCNGGQKMRSREVEQMANKWGAPCPREGALQVTECGQKPCPCQDCVWGDWSAWGACTCLGLRERHRSIYTHRDDCGQPCTGAKVESESCTPDCIKDPVDCVMGEWSYWSECSADCGGGQHFRTREIEVPEKHEGRPCSDQMTKETRPCNEDACKEPVDCVLAEWSYWTSCSATCGGGQKYRTRDVSAAAEAGGKPCEGSLKEVESCASDPCIEPVDCVWGEWTEYGACSATCGGGQKTRDREIAVAPRFGGKLCDPKVKEEVAPCNQENCDLACIDGQWDEWGEWSTCTATCGSGFQWRNREILQRPNGCGKPLEGVKQEMQPCPGLEPCDPDARDCLLSEWTEWGDCSCTCNGVRDRSRRIEVAARNGGKPCTGQALKEIEPCNVESCDVFDPVDCVMGDWGYPGECSATCGGGVLEVKREVLVFPKNQGKGCAGPLSRIEPCNTQRCDSRVDCRWSEWSEWGECTAQCGGGQKSRYRRVEDLPKDGGTECAMENAVEEAACNLQACGKQYWCAWQEWSPFTECSVSCGVGTKKRQRSLVSTTDKPPSEVSVIVTGILDSVFRTDVGVLKYSASHLIVTFLAGLATTVVALLLMTRVSRLFSGPSAPLRNGRAETLLEMASAVE